MVGIDLTKIDLSRVSSDRGQESRRNRLSLRDLGGRRKKLRLASSGSREGYDIAQREAASGAAHAR